MTGGESNFDPYETLGVTRLATEGDIRLAYRHLVKRYHPDLHPGDATLEDRIRQINEAYAILSDPVRRAALEAEPDFETVAQPKARPPQRSPDRTRAARRAATQRAEAERARAAQRKALAGKGARVLLYAALIVTVGTLLVRLLHPVQIVLALQDYVEGAGQAAASPAPDPRLAVPADAVYRAPPQRARVAAVAPPPSPPPAAKPASDPCGPGTVCYDRKTYGHSGWFIRRGHGSDHPT